MRVGLHSLLVSLVFLTFGTWSGSAEENNLAKQSAQALHQKHLQAEIAAHAARRFQIERVGNVPSALTLAPEKISHGQPFSGPQITIKQAATSTAPLAPPAPVFDGIELVDAMLFGIYNFQEIPKNSEDIGGLLRIYLEYTEAETEKVQERAEKIISQFFKGQIETQDDPISTLVKFVFGGSSGPLPQVDGRAPLGKNVMFVASFAPSNLGGNDTAVLLGAAEVNADPTQMVWHKFRIQLTKANDNTHFCTPSATASVLTNFRMAATQSGRLFIVFDSFENSTSTGSILDIDVASLLAGGVPKLKCFTGTQYAHLTPPDVRDTNTKAYFLGIKDLATVKRFVLNTAVHVANDNLTATDDIGISAFDFNPAAVQPNGFHLYDGGFDFRVPSVQLGNSIWNIHVIGDGNAHAKVRFYKFSVSGTVPRMTLTLSTRQDQADDLISPSFDVDSTHAYVTFTRTVSNNAQIGNATLMMANGPNGSASHWTSMVLAKSAGQINKDMFGNPCDSFEFAGCAYGPNSSTLIDPFANSVWAVGELITTGTLGTGGAGNEVNWLVKGGSVPR